MLWAVCCGSCGLGCVLWLVWLGLCAVVCVALGCALWVVWFGLCAVGCVVWVVPCGLCVFGVFVWCVWFDLCVVACIGAELNLMLAIICRNMAEDMGDEGYVDNFAVYFDGCDWKQNCFEMIDCS